VDCMMTSVIIAAQYASGRPERRAIRNAAVAASAVRAALVTVGQPRRDGEVIGTRSSRGVSFSIRGPAFAGSISKRPQSFAVALARSGSTPGAAHPGLLNDSQSPANLSTHLE